MYPRVLSMIGALRGFVMYSHDRCPKRVVMYTHAIEHVSSYIEHGPSFCALGFYCTSDEKRSCFLTYIVGNGGHVEHVSACIEHDVALKRVVMYPHVIEHVSSYIEHGPSFCTLEVVWYE